MNKLFILTLCLVGCGYASKDNEAVGQVKRIIKNTPILCSNFDDVDISLGVLRDGVGSMSTEDIWLNIIDVKDFSTLKEAQESGALVKIKYNTARVRFCTNDRDVTSVELVK